MIIDNCSARRNISTIPNLSHVNVKFLPPNKISNIQPMNAGIIDDLKIRYRIFLLEKVLELIDENIKFIYQLNVLPAIKMVENLWRNIEPRIINHCWHHTKIERENSNLLSTFFPNLLHMDDFAVQAVVETLIFLGSRISISMLINMSRKGDQS